MFKTQNLRFTNIAFYLSFLVIILGAFTRLTDAGLGCPDWPGCYGKLIAPMAAHQPHIEPHKAWIEMIHRYAAGILGGLIFLLLMIRVNSISILLTVLVIFQALLGMWTVTLRLYPVVVMAHLLGGMAILSLLWWQKLNLVKRPNLYNDHFTKNLCSLCIVIIIGQIALGAWTSANYAALVCADFPTCQGKLWPVMDFKTAFALFKIGIADSPGTPLENTARVTIQMSHRLGALISFILLSSLACSLLSSNKLFPVRKLGKWLFILLFTQITLGIINVLAALPLPIALLHNALAAILLLTLITIRRDYAPN